MTNNHRTLSSVACQLKIFLSVELMLCVKAMCIRTAARNQLNCEGSRTHSRITHHEGVVSLTIRILLSTVTSHSVKDCPFLCPVVRMGWSKPGFYIYPQELRTF